LLTHAGAKNYVTGRLSAGRHRKHHRVAFRGCARKQHRY